MKSLLVTEVLLPAPLWPRYAKVSPGWTLKLMSWRTGRRCRRKSVRNALLTRSNAITDMTLRFPPDRNSHTCARKRHVLGRLGHETAF